MVTAPDTDTELFDELAEAMTGELTRPADPGYDEARTVWNGLIDKHPAAIAACESVDDVVTAVTFASEQDLLLAVRSNGHDYAGNSVCDDGLVIDLSAMDSVAVDPATQTAQVGPGATWGDVYPKTQEHGLSTIGGAGIVGVAGFTLGGGISYLSRTHGLALDNLRSAEVVTANGDVVTAGADENPELFWALRGGSGNFGVVTSFEFDLFEVGPKVLAGQVLYPLADARDVIGFYREFAREAPHELGGFVILLPIPPEEPFPEEYHGDLAVSVAVCYDGDPEDGAEAVAPLREFGDPILDGIMEQPYLEFKLGNDEFYGSIDRWYSKSQYLAGCPDAAIDTMVEYLEDAPAPITLIGLLGMDGAVNDVDASATAFPHRDAAFEFDIWPAWSDPAQDTVVMEWARSFHEAMEPYAAGGVYVNMLSHDEDDRVPEAYGENYERLAAIKAEWDPENLFRMNQNIPPAE